MPHGGYHGVVKVGNTIVQQGSPAGAPPGQGGRYNPDGYATEMAGSPAPAQNNQTAKQLEEQIKQQMAKDEDPRSAYIAAQADAARLTNLIKKEQEEAFRRRIIDRATPDGLSSITRLTSDPVDIEQGFVRTEPGRLRKSDLLGYSDGLFGLNIGATPVVGLANIDVNPITGERITTAKAREGLTTPEYNEFIQKLYDTNPQLFEEQFPVASGQALKPLLVRIGEGIMGLPGASQMGQLASSVISPLSNLFTGKTAATSFVNPKAPTGGSGIVEAIPTDMDMSIYGSFIGKPGPFTADFIDQDQDGVDDRFQSGPGEAKAPPYSPPKQPFEITTPQFKTVDLPALTDYASMAPQFTGSQYTNQGISPAFLENLRRFYG